MKTFHEGISASLHNKSSPVLRSLRGDIQNRPTLSYWPIDVNAKTRKKERARDRERGRERERERACCVI